MLEFGTLQGKSISKLSLVTHSHISELFMYVLYWRHTPMQQKLCEQTVSPEFRTKA